MCVCVCVSVRGYLCLDTYQVVLDTYQVARRVLRPVQLWVTVCFSAGVMTDFVMSVYHSVTTFYRLYLSEV